MNKNDINIIIDQQLPPADKKEKGAAYYAEMIKAGMAEHANDLSPAKVTNLNKLKEKKLLTVNEAAELFGIGRNKIRELTNDKDCPYVIWIGSHRRIKREAFEKFISELFAV